MKDTNIRIPLYAALALAIALAACQPGKATELTHNGPSQPVVDYRWQAGLGATLSTDRGWDKYAPAHEKKLNK